MNQLTLRAVIGAQICLGLLSIFATKNICVLADTTQPLTTTNATITIDVSASGRPISKTLYGIFFEEINRAGDGGIYGEMLQNRSFEDAPIPLGWSLQADSNAEVSMSLDKSLPLNAENPTSLRLDVSHLDNGRSVGIVNQGFKGIAAPGKTIPAFLDTLKTGWLDQYNAAQSNTENGLAVAKAHKYNFSFYARCDHSFTAPITISLERQDGSHLAEKTITGVGSNWQKFSTVLTADGSDTNAKFVLSVNHTGTIWFDMVSLFPDDTFMHRPNGLRNDLMQWIVALHPAFVRFPGGSFAEGNVLSESYDWKETIGNVAARPGRWNIWGYRSSDGLGFQEYLQMCEDIHAKPLFVINAGMSEAEIAPIDQIAPYVQNAVDAIEYADGPITSHWGAIRAANGHPKSFGLHLVEIGNENGLNYPWGGGTPEQYLERYRLFYDAIKKRFPWMTVIANIDLPANKDIIDEHYYDYTTWFETHADLFDKVDRKGPKIYVGEYAVTHDAGKGNLKAALAEAAFMTGLERNGDIVAMSSYAPLFCNDEWRRWQPDAIVFNSARIYGTPSYYAQKMFATSKADDSLPISVTPSDSGQPSFFVAAGRMEKTGKLIIKVVNTSGEDCNASLNLTGLSHVKLIANATVMQGSDPDAENSFASPTLIAPRTETVSIPGNVFTHVFPAYSVTVLRLESK